MGDLKRSKAGKERDFLGSGGKSALRSTHAESYVYWRINAGATAAHQSIYTPASKNLRDNAFNSNNPWSKYLWDTLIFCHLIDAELALSPVTESAPRNSESQPLASDPVLEFRRPRLDPARSQIFVVLRSAP